VRREREGEKTCEVFVACTHYSKKYIYKKRGNEEGEKDDEEERRCAQ